jgi:hypothetical protein
LDRSPVPFSRTKAQRPLPLPERGGRLDDLRPFVNASDDAWALVTGWLLGALQPDGPKCVLVVQGEQGSAKSTLSKLLKSLVDPSLAPLRTLPRDEHGLWLAATHAWVLAFDNLSKMTAATSDALCRLATGGGMTKRKLRTDADEVIFDATRPFILNGIEELATRPDLAERSLVITLAPILPERRRPERDVLAEFERARPRVLGALLDAAVEALRNVDGVQLNGYPRMADFARWVVAGEPALPWRRGAFLDAMQRNAGDATAAAMEADPVALPLQNYIGRVKHFSGTATQLLAELNKEVPEALRATKGWPTAPNSLSNHLNRLQPVLRRFGIDIDNRKSGGARQITMDKTP